MVFRGQDAWRRHPVFKYKFADVFPGMREASVLFVAYLGVEWGIEKFAPHEAAAAKHHAPAGHAATAAAAQHH